MSKMSTQHACASSSRCLSSRFSRLCSYVGSRSDCVSGTVLRRDTLLFHTGFWPDTRQSIQFKALYDVCAEDYYNHNHNHECISALSTSIKTDSTLQCLSNNTISMLYW